MKKRIIIIPLIALFAALWTAAFHAAAATRYSDGVYTFEKTASGTAVITDCLLTGSNVEVPGSVLGFPVEGIGDYAFMSCSTLRSVTLPSSAVSIGEYAFAENRELQTVTIPPECASIAGNAFFNSPNVTIRCRYGSAAHAYALEKQLSVAFTDDVLLGDLDGDRHISINDVTAIQRHAAELEPLEGILLLAADADQSGGVDIGDATALQMYLAEYQSSSPIGEPMIFA